MAYKFTAKWQKGSQHEAADALSRFPLSVPNSNDELAELEIDVANGQDGAHSAMSHAQIRAPPYKNQTRTTSIYKNSVNTHRETRSTKL